MLSAVHCILKTAFQVTWTFRKHVRNIYGEQISHLNEHNYIWTNGWSLIFCSDSKLKIRFKNICNYFF